MGIYTYKTIGASRHEKINWIEDLKGEFNSDHKINYTICWHVTTAWKLKTNTYLSEDLA